VNYHQFESFAKVIPWQKRGSGINLCCCRAVSCDACIR